MKTALIDGDFLLFVCTHKKLGSPDLTLESVQNSADAFIEEILNRVEATHYLGFLTASPTFRKVEYPEYKKSRTSKPLPEFFLPLRNYLKEHWAFNEVPLYEADDLVNIYYNHFKGPEETIIVSPDKDILNLHGVHYNPLKKEIKITSLEDAEEFFWRSMIKGDSTDGIIGIHGRGDKYVNKVFATDLRRVYGPPLAVLMSYLEAYPEPKAIKEFYKNYRLLKILEKPLSEDFEFLTPIPLNNDF